MSVVAPRAPHLVPSSSGPPALRRVVALFTAALMTVLGLLAGGARPASAAVTEVGPVVAWGENGLGSLDVPPSLGVTGATAIAAGLYHNLALTPSGQVVTWGRIQRIGVISTPAWVGSTTMVAIAAGGYHSLGVTPGGQVLGWGDDSYGQADPPASLTGRTVVAVAGGEFHSLALTSDGQVVGWGDDSYGQVDIPAALTGRTVTAIAAGALHSLALTSDGQVVVWGDLNAGSNLPPASLGGRRVTAIAAGSLHSLALTADGQVVAWGSRSSGETDVPASLTGRTVVAIAAGSSHSVALTSDGQVTAWGADSFGQSDVPASLTGKTVVAIAAGSRDTIALTRAVSLQVTSSPQPADVELGATASFAASAAGGPTPSVQWQRSDRGAGFHDVPGATGTTYAFRTVAADDGAAFRAVFTNATGTVTTDAATLRVNSPPTVRALAVTTGYGSAVPITLAGTDPNADPLTYAVAGPPSHGTLSGTPPLLTYTPAAGWSGADAFTYTATDGRSVSPAARVDITVAARPNAAPVARDLDVSTAFQSPTLVTLAGTDPDGDALAYAVVSPPAHGTLSGTAPRLTYTPAPGYSGSDVFTYQVDDGTLRSAVAKVAVAVSPPSCRPTTPRQTFRVDAAGRLVKGVLSSPRFSTKEPGELLLALVSVTGPARGTQTVTRVSGGGLTWTLAQRENATGGTTEVWQAYAATTLRSTRVTLGLKAPGHGVTLSVAGFSGARPRVGAVAHRSGKRSAPEVALAPQASGSAVWAAGRVVGSRYDPRPVAGQQVVHAQRFTSPAAGTWVQRATAATTAGARVRVADTAPAKSWGYAAVEIRSRCG